MIDYRLMNIVSFWMIDVWYFYNTALYLQSGCHCIVRISVQKQSKGDFVLYP
jgi:hypothetical protein